MSNEVSTFEAYSNDGHRITGRDVRGSVVYQGRAFKTKSGRVFQVVDIKPEDESPVVTINIRISS